jgi:predicted Zn-dependent protease
MADPLKSYKLSPQLRSELHFSHRRNHHAFEFEMPQAAQILKKLPWKAIGFTVLIFAVVISAYVGIKKGYDYAAAKNAQADLARQQEYENHLASVKQEVTGLAADAYSFVKLSQNYIKSGDAERAEAAAKLAVEKDPAWRDGYVNLGQIYLATNNFEQAKLTLEEALKHDPVYGQTHYLLALAYQELNDDGKSKEEYAKAKDFGFNSEIGG